MQNKCNTLSSTQTSIQTALVAGNHDESEKEEKKTITEGHFFGDRVSIIDEDKGAERKERKKGRM